MDIGQLFFDRIQFDDGNEGTYNELTFEINDAKTHFNATSIMQQCGELLGIVDKRGKASKTWTDFENGKAGRIPVDSFYTTKRNRCSKVRWVKIEEMLSILVYSLGGGNIVTKFLLGRQWIESTGHVYLIRAVVQGEVVMKYGHTWDIPQRMKGYKRECDSHKPIASCLVENVIETEKLIGEYLYAHGAIRHSKGCEWFTYGKIVSESECNRAFNDWLDALYEIEPSLLEKVVEYDQKDVKEI